ncbi:MAG: hydroxyacylglutathione hydrolase [Alphaproteobacteria bacterium]|nr:hydroxyacylglutathione hydrolase [Alphaproteobacteria bacterium]
MPLEIIQLSALSDNYIYILHNADTQQTAVIDPSEADPVRQYVASRGWNIDYILNTHHHFDHTDGNKALKAQYECEIIGYGPDAERIAGITRMVHDEDRITVCASEARVMFVPGHTRGHIAFYFAHEKALFCGDTMFLMGCGRLFEGTAEQMYDSLQKFASLPDDTNVYCAHEYTLSNARFALSIEPENSDLKQRMKNIQDVRNQNQSTVPALLAVEKQTNPFLRVDSPEIRSNLNMQHANNIAVFAEIRKLKDHF